MRVHAAPQHLQLDVAFGVHREDPCHGRVCVLATHDDVTSGDRHEPGTGVLQPRSEAPVSRHVHEVDVEVVVVHQQLSVPRDPGPRMGHRLASEAV